MVEWGLLSRFLPPSPMCAEDWSFSCQKQVLRWTAQGHSTSRSLVRDLRWAGAQLTRKTQSEQWHGLTPLLLVVALLTRLPIDISPV